MATDVRGGLVERPVDPEKPREQQKAEKRSDFTLPILVRALFPEPRVIREVAQQVCETKDKASVCPSRLLIGWERREW